MPTMRAFRKDLDETIVAIQWTRRYWVTATNRARVANEDGDTIVHFEPVKQQARPVRTVRRRGVNCKLEYSRSRHVVRRVFDLQTPASADRSESGLVD